VEFRHAIGQDVWRSLKYEEASYDVDGLVIIDARGQLSNGNRWRYLGKFVESASYSNMARQRPRSSISSSTARA